MKSLLVFLAFVLASSFAAAKNTAVQKPTPSCAEAMERAKKSQPGRLFVGFADKEVIKKLRETFPDLREHVFKALRVCTLGDPEEKELLMATVPRTDANVERLRSHNNNQAG